MAKKKLYLVKMKSGKVIIVNTSKNDFLDGFRIPKDYKLRRETERTRNKGKTGKKSGHNYNYNYNYNIFTIPKETTEMTTELTTEKRTWLHNIPTKFTTKRTTEITTESTTEPIGKRNECACGKQFLSNYKRGEMEREEIAGGEVAVPEEFPWLVRILGGCAGG